MDRALALEMSDRQANVTDEPETYANTATLGRTSHTTPWLDRDRQHVTTTRVLDPNAAGLIEAASTAFTIAGSLVERANQLYMTRHGLYRRSDAKFAEFVAQPTKTGDDGYGMWRVWESHGACPYELLVADPWGTISWEAAPDGGLRPIDCSWVVRPGMFRHEGYFKLSRARIALSFRTFSLASPVEVLEVYDGADFGAPLLARFEGNRVPEQITSTGAEVRIVLTADLNRTAADAWQNVYDAVADEELGRAQSHFIFAARSRLRGFFRQDMRRILRAVAVRLSARHSWMRRKWFAGDGLDFERAYNVSLYMVLEDFSGWQKRHRNEEGKEHVAWDATLSARRYPMPIREPTRNPYYSRSGELLMDADAHVQLQRHLGYLPQRPSGFSLDFTTSADCRGKGIAPYGDALLPPLTLSSEPRSNFEFLPFPMSISSCQPMIATGPQTTSDRPYTIADTVMKSARELQMHQCVGEGVCDLEMAGEAAGNCSISCDPFMGCVRENVGNRSAWQIGKHHYNKSLVAQARERCLQLPEAAGCIDIAHPAQYEPPFSRLNPKSAGCLQLPCASCAVTTYSIFFRCATECSENMEDPTADCIDCSYSFESLYDGIDKLYDRLWEAYFAGIFGFHLCPSCPFDDPSMMRDDVPMSQPCRRCHYAIEDFLNSELYACLDQGGPAANGRRCFDERRGSYNFEQDFYRILKPGDERTLDMTLEGNLAELLGATYTYAGTP